MCRRLLHKSRKWKFIFRSAKSGRITYRDKLRCMANDRSGQAEMKLIFVINMMINNDEVFYEVDQSS